MRRICAGAGGAGGRPVLLAGPGVRLLAVLAAWAAFAAPVAQASVVAAAAKPALRAGGDSTGAGAGEHAVARTRRSTPRLAGEPPSVGLAASSSAGVPLHLGPPLVERQRSLYDWGEARYQDRPLASWEDLRGQGKLGASCEAEEGGCGTQLVCRQNLCRHCHKSSECPSLHECEGWQFGTGTCRRIEQKAWERAFTNPFEAFCSCMIFFASALAAAAGTGGGGMFVPLLVSLSGLKTDKAVPCSQFMIFLGSIVNLVCFASQRHPKAKQQPVIDYDCIVLLEPMLCLGVMCGVLANQVTPQWMLLLLLCLTMGLALQRTATKGFKQWREEANKPPLQVTADTPRQISKDSTEEVRTCFDLLVPKDFVQLTNMKAWQLILTVIVWMSMLASSFHGLSVCSWRFAGFIMQIAAVLLFLTYVAARRMRRLLDENPDPSSKPPIDWTAHGLLRYPAMAFTAGFLGGLLGLGGGIVMGPVLLEVGMHSEAVQATTAVFVFLSSSLASIQFARMGETVWHYAIWYGFVTIGATLLGQWVCDVFVRKRGKYSLITLSIAGVLFASLSALFFIGIGQVMEDLYMGREMGFSSTRLCNAGGSAGIVSSDLVPADQWPSDLERWEATHHHR